MNGSASLKTTKKDDALLIVGQTLSQVSDRMVQLGLIWFITSNFGEFFLIWYLAAGGLPHVFLMKFSGKIISKLSALKSVLYSDFSRGGIYLLAYFVLTFFSDWMAGNSSVKTLGLLFLSVFLSNIFSAFFNPAILSLSVEIKEASEVQKLTAKLSSVTSLATIVGPVVGLFVFNKFGLSGLFIIASFCYFISTYSISLLSRSAFNKSIPTNAASLSSDFQLFASSPIIGVMLAVFFVINLLLSPLQVLMPSMAKDLFGNSFNSLAVLETLVGAGILMGGALLSFFSIQKRPLFWTWFCLVLVSFAYLVFTFAADFGTESVHFFDYQILLSFLTSALSLFSLGFSLGVANILIINILQTQPKPDHVPKVMSYVNLISTATLPFSLALFGILQSSLTIFTLGQLAAILLVLVSLVAYFPFRYFGQGVFK